jgi:hypothetical protein
MAIRVAAALVAALVCVVTTAAQAGFNGAWVLNQDRSTFEPLANRPNRRVVTLDIKGDAVTHTTETSRTVLTEVEPFQEESTSKVTYTARFDGREHPVPNSSARVTLTRIDATSFERRAATGKASETGTWVLSKDGKTLTVTTKGLDEYGMSFTSVQVYERVTRAP